MLHRFGIFCKTHVIRGGNFENPDQDLYQIKKDAAAMKRHSGENNHASQYAKPEFVTDLKNPTYLKSPTARTKNTIEIPSVIKRKILEGISEPSHPQTPAITKAAVNRAAATTSVANVEGVNSGLPSTLGTPTPVSALPATAQ